MPQSSPRTGDPITGADEPGDLGERAGVISESLATALRPSIGLRNVLVHEYLEIDLRQVAAAAAEAARDYAAYVRDVSAWARSGPETH